MRRGMTILMKTVGWIGLVVSLLLLAEAGPLVAAEPIKIGAVFPISGWARFPGHSTKRGDRNRNRRGQPQRWGFGPAD